MKDTPSGQYENNVVQWLEGQQGRRGGTAKGGTGFKDEEVVSVPRSRKMRLVEKDGGVTEDLVRPELWGETWKEVDGGLDLSRTSTLLKPLEYQCLQGACWKCRLPGPGLDHWHQSLHLNKSSRWFLLKFKVETRSFGELGCEGEEKEEGRWREYIFKGETLILPKEGRLEHE